ncbi:complement C1q-like protein 2 [Nothobranchius furzeri]|uniref:Complement C1q-like protein 2 n=1 Tax=Nothobranchius furzeri TaxID=105023 RepID=A0A8C6KFQ1_NOTFU|nr:complement C1q-like protein 2 [Nothobranchius furzeri]
MLETGPPVCTHMQENLQTSRGFRGEKQTITSREMKTIAVLILASGLCLCEPGNDENNDRAFQRSSSTSCCDVCSLTSIGEKMGVLGEKVASMAERITLLETKLGDTEREVLELRSITGGTPRVAFSAALLDSGSGNTGPFSVATPLKYKKVFSNTGNNYNPSTGTFTATVSGMYFFRFSMFNNLAQTPNSVVSLMKNDERLTSVWDVSGSDSNDMGSNAAVIPLVAGDAVYVELMASRLVYDDGMNYNTFSGFLLFTM